MLATLWRSDAAMTPGEVREQLGGELAYTTVMTILARLHDKGSVTRIRNGRAFSYRPAHDQADFAAAQMREVLDAGHDREAVLARFVGSLTSDEEKTLATLLRRASRRAKK